MIIVGTGLQLKQFKAMLRSPVPLVGGIILQLIMLPAGALGIIILLQPAPELAAGLLLVSACPSGALSNYYCHLGRLNVALSVMMTTVSTLIAVISLPLVLSIVFPIIASVQETEISVTEIFNHLIIMLLLPIAGGMFLRNYYTKKNEIYSHQMRIFGLSLVIMLIALIVYDQWDGTKQLFADSAILALCFTSYALFCGWLFAVVIRTDSVDRYVFSVEFAVRNIGIAAIVAATALGRPEFVVFGALFVVIQFPVIILFLFRRPVIAKT